MSAGKDKQWQKVREQIVCSICLDLLQDPKTLPCLHTYCKECLKKSIANPSREAIIKCPACRKLITLSDKGVES